MTEENWRRKRDLAEAAIGHRPLVVRIVTGGCFLANWKEPERTRLRRLYEQMRSAQAACADTFVDLPDDEPETDGVHVSTEDEARVLRRMQRLFWRRLALDWFKPRARS